ncbi:hypothetical protein B0J18DRAFT_469662 [Chaetomium sp. MPI-SDFR-AT-0129]|nr:hypothetical protein B0J18DRAFT_469662 [Chaetomium sp. MPI-SDFR-AT-0129]
MSDTKDENKTPPVPPTSPANPPNDSAENPKDNPSKAAPDAGHPPPSPVSCHVNSLADPNEAAKSASDSARGSGGPGQGPFPSSPADRAEPPADKAADKSNHDDNKSSNHIDVNTVTTVVSMPAKDFFEKENDEFVLQHQPAAEPLFEARVLKVDLYVLALLFDLLSD